MADWNFARSIAGIRLLVELGAAHALTKPQCLLGTGIRERDLEDPNCVISAGQELRLIRNLLVHLPHVPALGVEAGMRYHYTAFGMLGFALVTSQSARNALEVGLRYFNLTYAFSRFTVVDTEQETYVMLDSSSVPDDVRHFIIERDSAALVTIQEELVPNAAALSRVDLPFRAPSDLAPYQRGYGLTPNFGQSCACVAFYRDKLSLPIPQANELVRRFSEEQCMQLLERYRLRVGLAAKVRERLVCNLAIDMEDMAKLLCMTSRTLRRQLEDEGASFTAIKDEVRLALAEEYLVALKLSVEETAYRLGYVSSSAFITAFRRLTGETPLVFKNRAAKSSQGGGLPASPLDE